MFSGLRSSRQGRCMAIRIAVIIGFGPTLVEGQLYLKIRFRIA